MRRRFQGLWKNSNFTKLWSSHTISNIGNGITGIALPLLTRGAIPLSALLAGILATSIGVRLTLLIGVVGVMIAGLWLLCSPVRTIHVFENHTS